MRKKSNFYSNEISKAKFYRNEIKWVYRIQVHCYQKYYNDEIKMINAMLLQEVSYINSQKRSPLQ